MSKVLIADDKSPNRMALKVALTRQGVNENDILIASSGEEAALFGTQCDDLIIAILDMDMKPGSGATAAAALRKHHSNKKLDIYIWSSGDQSNKPEFINLNVVFIELNGMAKLDAIKLKLNDILAPYLVVQPPPKLSIASPTEPPSPAVTPVSIAQLAVVVYPHPCGVPTPKALAPKTTSSTISVVADKKDNDNLQSIKDEKSCCCQCVCLCGVVKSIRNVLGC